MTPTRAMANLRMHSLVGAAPKDAGPDLKVVVSIADFHAAIKLDPQLVAANLR